jgi:hypothetical protein
MARHYYLTRSGRLRRKDNTLCFEPATDKDREIDSSQNNAEEESHSSDAFNVDSPKVPLDLTLENEGMGDLLLEPEMSGFDASAG